ncbi:MAG TPA: hypothetical protein VGR71_06135 [Nitrospira sp.]|nr:hypothetical protein [Nitrospira sp.]
MTGIPKPALIELRSLDFTGKGEAFVESRFLTPLLALLGYESHKDYEVIRHGDDGSAFKLRYPPVEKGAQRVKHYNPDYIPTIRKRMFWIIEAKSAKEVPYPFEAKFLVQGLQYCVHPEIQAKYLLLSNGVHSCLYDAHGAIFFDKDIYEPIFEFASTQVVDRWPEIFNLLSIEQLRTRIENDLKSMYDKLCLSSLDQHYPRRLLHHIGTSAGENARQIERHVRALYLEEIAGQSESWQKQMESLEATQVYEFMDVPLRGGPRSEGRYFVDKSLAADVQAGEIFDKLTQGFDVHCMFRKLQHYVALCDLYQRTQEQDVKRRCREFFRAHSDAELPLLSQVECALLRVTHKISVLNVYPPLRERLQQELRTASELVRFVNPPTAVSMLYPIELMQNRRMFAEIQNCSEEQLRAKLSELLAVEEKIDADFEAVRSKLPDSEVQMAGFESYGVGGKHYAFKTIPANRGIDLAEPS